MPATLSTVWAPAKVNLYLHVGRPGAGGLHPLDSLVVFADNRAADRVSARVQAQMSLQIEGTFAKALKSAPHNLTLAAAKLLRDACDRYGLGADLVLRKELPIASGVGGGSSDAAATLHLLNELWGVKFGEAALEGLGEQLGMDVPACVRARPLVMRGAGEKLTDVTIPDLPAVLINPGISLETRRVFESFDRKAGGEEFSDMPPPPMSSADHFIEKLRAYRNDLEAVAIELCPEISKVLAILHQAPGCKLARMSGSGATCFGLFDSEEAADEAARTISVSRKKYWIRATTFRGNANQVVNPPAAQSLT